MKNLVIRKNPESDETTQDREEAFSEFCQQVSELAEEYGYTDFLVTVRDSEKPVLHSTAICTDTAKIAYDLRNNAFALAKEFVMNMIPQDDSF